MNLNEGLISVSALENLLNGLSKFTGQYILIVGIVGLVILSITKARLYRYSPPLLFTITLIFALYFQNREIISFPLITSNNYSFFFQALSYITGLFTCFLIENSRLTKSDKKTELYILLLFSILGMSTLAISKNLLMIFLGLECISIPSYCLAAFGFSSKSSEAAVKYVLYGSAATGIMLYGMSLLYGLTGTLEIAQLIDLTSKLTHSGIFLVSVVMLLVGLLFKIAAFPFHSWAPDVYEGTPTSLVAFFSIAPKALAFCILMRISPLLQVEVLKTFLVFISISSMTIGNLLALTQVNAKRLLAYSSVSHAGFLLMGITIGNDIGFDNLIYYLCIYLLMNFSAFHLLQIMSRWKESSHLDSFTGLGKSNPYLATSLLITMISLTGLPPAAGFSAKLFMFSSVYESYRATNDINIFIMLMAALLNTVVSLFYYLKMPFYAFFRDNNEKKALLLTNSEKVFILTLNALLLLFFLKPDWVFSIINLTKLEG